MGLFGSKGKECWFCSRKTTEDGIFLSSDDLMMIFTDVFSDFNADTELKDNCVCKVCAGILKYTSQDSVAAKIALADASDKVKAKFGMAKSRLSSKLKRD